MVCPAIQECPDVVKIVLLQDLKGVDVLPGVDNVQVEILLRGHVLRRDEVHDSPNGIHIIVKEQNIWFLLDKCWDDPSVPESTHSRWIEFKCIQKSDSGINETILNFLTLIILESVVDHLNPREGRQVIREFIGDPSVPSPLITVGTHEKNFHRSLDERSPSSLSGNKFSSKQYMTTNIQVFSGTVTATGFTGTATNATNAVLATDDTNASRPVIFGTGTTGNVPLKTDPGLVYNPSTNKLTAGAFVGDGSELTNLPGFNPNVDKIAIGNGAGTTDQLSDSVAIGHDAGQTSQNQYGIAIGNQAGQTSQFPYGIAIGYRAGNNSNGYSSIAIGNQAGETSQGNQTVAIGTQAGETSQGYRANAIGTQAGYSNQGSYAVAMGYQAGYSGQGFGSIAVGAVAGGVNQPAGTTYFRFSSIRDANGNEYLHITNAGEMVRGNGYSDDRLKYDEKFITGAVKSLFKLRPQEYLKKPKLIPDPDHDEEWIHESGLMAQEVYYSAPELRHLVTVSETAGDIDTLTPAPSDDPTQDPDYSVWGDKPSGIKYIQFIPYLIKGIQEIVTELPRSKTTVSNTWDQNITGLVVSADTNTHKTNVTPIVSLSNVAMDKAWYGVVSDQKTDTNDYDTLVDTNGDTRIWVSDVGGSLESGDLVTTSNIAPGYTQKQSDDIVRNYTVGKVTQECDFTEPLQVSVKIPKKELSNVKYYVKSITREIQLSEYELFNNIHTTVETTPMYICEVQKDENHDIERFYRGDVEVSTQPGEDITQRYFLEKTTEEYEELDDEEKARYTLGTRNIYKHHSQTRSTRLIPEHEEEVFIEEMVDVLDGNGQIVWEETDETEPIYTLVDHGTHKAALLTCKLY